METIFAWIFIGFAAFGLLCFCFMIFIMIMSVALSRPKDK